MAGAVEVQEDRHMKVDLPVDQIKHNPFQNPPNELFSMQSLNGLPGRRKALIPV